MGSSEKLKEFFKAKGKSQNDLAKDLGVSTSYINALLNGRKTFGKRQAMIFAEKYGLSPSWLLTGTGEMVVNHNGSIEAHLSGGGNIRIDAHKEIKSDDVQLAVLKNENEMLRAQLKDRDKQIEFLKSLINK